MIGQGVDPLIQVIRSEVVSGDTPRNIRDAMKVDDLVTEAIDKATPTDNGQVPAAPANLRHEALGRALEVRWDLPALEDYVIESRVRLVNETTGVETELRTANVSVVATGLELAMYTVHVAHRNMWDRWSAESTLTSLAPLPNVSDEITEATRVAGGEFAQLLNNPALAAFDSPTKLVDGVLGTLSGVQNGTYPQGEGVVGYKLIAALDVVAARAIFGNAIIETAMIANAAISTAKIDSLAVTEAKIALLAVTTGKIESLAVTSAKINSLTFDKLSGGSLTANLVVATGRIESGGFRMDSTGAQLLDTANYILAPSEQAASGLTNTGSTKWAKLHCFSTTESPFVRGFNMAATGIFDTGRDGLLRFQADNGNSNPDSVNTALLVLQSSSQSGTVGTVKIKEDVGINRDLEVVRNAHVFGSLAINGTVNSASRYIPKATRTVTGLPGSNTWYDYNHNEGRRIMARVIWTSPTVSGYRDPSVAENVTVEHYGNTLRVRNQRSQSIDIIVENWG